MQPPRPSGDADGEPAMEFDRELVRNDAAPVDDAGLRLESDAPGGEHPLDDAAPVDDAGLQDEARADGAAVPADPEAAPEPEGEGGAMADGLAVSSGGEGPTDLVAEPVSTTRRAARARSSLAAQAATAPLRLDFRADLGSEAQVEGRPEALRIAGLHLRTGQHALARAELESLAGRGRLDEEALLDLAEVRWRTGDLPGAGDAANALLVRGAESPLALVIAAEAIAAAGRPGEARRLSTRALEVADGPLDALFAGMPRSVVWPAASSTAVAEPRPRGRGSATVADGAPSTAAEAFAGGRAALARGDASRAALLLSVAIRLEPAFAADVARAVAGRDDQPLLALVRGDALRLLGREREALDAFERARGRSSAAVASPPPVRSPGLFDVDPVIAEEERS